MKVNWLNIVDREVYDLFCSREEIVGVDLSGYSMGPDFVIMNIKEVIMIENVNIDDFIDKVFKKISNFGHEAALSVLNFTVIYHDHSSTLSCYGENQG